jgi:chromosome segregation ATPase
VPLSFEGLLILIFAAALIAGLGLSLAHARDSLQDATDALAKASQDRATAEHERALAQRDVRQLRLVLAQASEDREEFRSEVRKARITLDEMRASLTQGEKEREMLLRRLEPAQQIIREATAIRATIESEKAAHERALTTRRLTGEHEILQLQAEAGALQRVHAVALQRYQALRQEIAALEARLAARQTMGDSPEVRPVTPPGNGTQPFLAPGIRPKGSTAPQSWRSR